MKTWRWLTLFLVAILLQTAQFGLSVKPNWILVVLVFLSASLPFSILIWLGFGAGLLADLFSGVNFGLNLAFYLLLGIVAKVIFRVGDVKFKNPAMLLTTLLATIFYNLALALPYLKIGSSQNWFGLAHNVGLEIIYNELIMLALIAIAILGETTKRRQSRRRYS